MQLQAWTSQGTEQGETWAEIMTGDSRGDKWRITYSAKLYCMLGDI